MLIILFVLLSGKDDDKERTLPPVVVVPVEFDFRTGVSLITYYGVEATISQRLARTVITMQIDNAMNCTSIHGVTFQLPFSARVASMSTVADTGCKTHGDVQPLLKARDTFAESATQGIPSAYVEARDSDTYSLQVSLPPFGTSLVELVVEELLRQRVGKVEFNIPLVPNEEVDDVTLDITILDVNATSDATATNGPSFDIDLGGLDVNSKDLVSPFSLDIPNARYHDLPPILHGSFTPSVLPDNGVLLRDGDCFEHIFLPATLEPISKNVIFLWDTTTYDWDKRRKAFYGESKTALKSLIDQLTNFDQLTIQTFADRGTIEVWAAERMTNTSKLQAKQFVDSVHPVENSGTNLHEALLEALVRAKKPTMVSDAGQERGSEAGVTLLVLLSNSRPEYGATNRSEIARDVWELNQRSQAKIFGLASPDADIDLLRAIAIMNNGVATSIPEATAPRMVNYFQSEFGVVLLSDIHIQYKFRSGSGGSNVPTLHGLTSQYFPVATYGTEVVVRGLLEPANNDATQQALLEAVTTAVTNEGEQSWNAVALNDPFAGTSPTNKGRRNTRCFQSYAHARITQLMNLRDVATELGDYVVEPVVTLSKKCNRTNTTLATCIEQEALSLAMEARLVARGLTGMVTIDEEECFVIKNGSEICLDGTSKGDFWPVEAGDSADGNGHDHYYGPADIETDIAFSRSTSWVTIFGISVIVWMISSSIHVIDLY